MPSGLKKGRLDIGTTDCFTFLANAVRKKMVMDGNEQPLNGLASSQTITLPVMHPTVKYYALVDTTQKRPGDDNGY